MDQLTLEMSGLPPLRQADPVPRRPCRPPPTTAPDEPIPGLAAAVGERVWLVWEDDEVLGIHADPDSAAADCAALRRHAQRSRLEVRYDWMAVPVFTDRRHKLTTAPEPRGAGGGWRLR